MPVCLLFVSSPTSSGVLLFYVPKLDNHAREVQNLTVQTEKSFGPGRNSGPPIEDLHFPIE